MFVKSSWYVAGALADIGRAPIHRLICEEAIVLYRKQNGEVVAMQDHCPHRRFALSKGRVEGDKIRCMYHGLLFNASGACTHIPGQDVIPANLSVRIYPVVEKYGWVWVWLGEKETVTDLQISGFAHNTLSEWKASFGDTALVADYRLMLDNAHDFTHVGYVHEATIGSTDVAEAEVKIEHNYKSVQFSRELHNVQVPPTFERLGKFKGKIDRSQIVRYTPPVHVSNEVRINPAGMLDKSGEYCFVVNNSFTPESSKSTRYYWSVARNFAVDDHEVGKLLYEEIARAFEEDRKVLDIQQSMLDLENHSVPLRNLKSDQANVLVRNILKRLIAAEHNRVS